MEYAIHALNRAGHRFAVGDVPLDQLQTLVHQPLQVMTKAGAEIVQHTDAIAATDQGLGDMRTDESGAAGDEVEGHVWGCFLSLNAKRAAFKIPHSYNHPPNPHQFGLRDHNIVGFLDVSERLIW